jgi:plasmid stability protein
VIENLDEQLANRLKSEAARHGHSMEEEVHQILRERLFAKQQPGLGTRLHQRFAAEDGVELELPERRSARSPDFSTE